MGHRLEANVATGLQCLRLPRSFPQPSDHGHTQTVAFQRAKNPSTLGECIVLVYLKHEFPNAHITALVTLAGGYRMRQSSKAQQLIDGIPVSLLIATVMPLLLGGDILPCLISKRQSINIEIIFNTRGCYIKGGPAPDPQCFTCMI